MRRIVIGQFFVLLVGFAFAWSNFVRETYDYLNNRACALGCSAGNAVINPIYTPCFGGAILFTIAFALSISLMIKSRKINQ